MFSQNRIPPPGMFSSNCESQQSLAFPNQPTTSTFPQTSVIQQFIANDSTGLSALMPPVVPFYVSRFAADFYSKRVVLQCPKRQAKDIPLANEPVNLYCYASKPILEWRINEVLSWVLSVARTFNIPIENLQLYNFLSISGKELSGFSENQLVTLEPTIGRLLYLELRGIMVRQVHHTGQPSPIVSGISHESVIKQGSPASDQSASTSTKAQVNLQSCKSPSVSSHVQHVTNEPVEPEPEQQQQLMDSVHAITDNNTLSADEFPQPSSVRVQAEKSRVNSDSTCYTTAFTEYETDNGPSRGVRKESVKKKSKTVPQKSLDIMRQKTKQKTLHETGSTGVGPKKEKRKYYKKSKRKHVLWRFILELLGEQSGPSIVTWENKLQGIFRITDSAQLASLWNEKKDRKTTMNYEKLSRAMRAYYKDSIVLPGPKCGLYPKKLVYQFGPNAFGWEEAAGLKKSESTSDG